MYNNQRLYRPLFASLSIFLGSAVLALPSQARAVSKYAVLIFEPMGGCSSGSSGSSCFSSGSSSGSSSSSSGNEWATLRAMWGKVGLMNGGSLTHTDFADPNLFRDGFVYTINNERDPISFQETRSQDINGNWQAIQRWIEKAAASPDVTRMVVEGHSFSGTGVVRAAARLPLPAYDKVRFFISVASPLAGHELAGNYCFLYGQAFCGLVPPASGNRMNELRRDTDTALYDTDRMLSEKLVVVAGEIETRGSDGFIDTSSQLFLAGARWPTYRAPALQENTIDGYRLALFQYFPCKPFDCNSHSAMNTSNAVQLAINWIGSTWNYCARWQDCNAGEGDCDGHVECASGLRCIKNRGNINDYSNNDVDVCESITPGMWNYCTREFPCALNEGDCDSNSDCGSGLRCNNDYGPGIDYCVRI